jgi:predicted dehydrogenase
MTSNVLRAGLVGYGFAGQTFHAPVISAVPGMVLAAVASSQPGKVRADWPGVDVVPDTAALVARADVDLVVVATPNAQHHPVAKAALEAGKHVVVDKPFTLDAAQARELAALAQRGGKLVGLPEPPFRCRFPDVAGLAGQRADRPPGVPRIAFRPLPPRGARALARAGSARGRAVGRPGCAPARPGPPIVRPCPTHCSSIARNCATAPRWRTTFHAVLRYETGRLRRCACCCTPPPLPHTPRRATCCTGTRGSYVKYGVDPQEDALRAGERPGGEGWASMRRTAN